MIWDGVALPVKAGRRPWCCCGWSYGSPTPPPRGLDKPLSVVVLMAEITPVPLGTAACLLKSGSRDVSAGPCVSPQRHKVSERPMRKMSRLEKERPFCEELKCWGGNKSIHCPNVPHPRQGDVRGGGGRRGLFCFVFPNLKISFKDAVLENKLEEKLGVGQDLQ